MNGLHILALSRARACEMADAVELFGCKVGKATVWDGIVPPNSYKPYGSGVRMARPEFFLFRKMAASNDVDARTYACEFLGLVATNLTRGDIGDGEYVELERPRTTIPRMLDYLQPVTACDEDAQRVQRLIMGMYGTTLVRDYGRFVRGCYTLAE